MRSWEFEPRPTFFGGRADSQDRMDLETKLTGKGKEKVTRCHIARFDIESRDRPMGSAQSTMW